MVVEAKRDTIITGVNGHRVNADCYASVFDGHSILKPAGCVVEVRQMGL